MVAFCLGLPLLKLNSLEQRDSYYSSANPVRWLWILLKVKSVDK